MNTPAQADLPGAGRVGTWVRGKYLVEAVIGTGGMATVYAARHRNKKRVALKMLHTELSGNADVRARFLREGYVANTVDHPGAVAVLDEDVAEDGSAFLVMELLHGASIETLAELQGGTLPLDVVLAMAAQTLEVLAAAHAKTVVHRDIKPANLFLTRDGHIKVLDYGIARLRETDASTTRTGTSMGTPAFMAPEQAAGQASLVDEQSDLWSLGATMFTLLTGRFVHEGETPQHMMVIAATHAPRPLSTSAPDLPTLAGAFLDRALAFDKAARWPSAVAMREALGDVYATLFGEPLTPAPLTAMASHVIPDSLRVSRGGVDSTDPRVQMTPSVGRPVPALPADGPGGGGTLHAVTRAPTSPRRLVPVWLSAGVATLAAAALWSLSARHAREMPAAATLHSAASEPHTAPVTPDVAPASPPPTGAAVAPPQAAVAPAVVPSASSAPVTRPSSIPAAPRRPRPVGGASATAPLAPTPTPNDFDRQ